MKRIIEYLAREHGLLHESGKVNYTAFARKCGLPPPTIMRWHTGVTKDVTREAAERVARAFGVTADQVLGFVPIERDNLDMQRSYELQPADREFLEKLRQLPTEDQYEIRQWVAREAGAV